MRPKKAKRAPKYSPRAPKCPPRAPKKKTSARLKSSWAQVRVQKTIYLPRDVISTALSIYLFLSLSLSINTQGLIRASKGLTVP